MKIKNKSVCKHCSNDTNLKFYWIDTIVSTKHIRAYCPNCKTSQYRKAEPKSYLSFLLNYNITSIFIYLGFLLGKIVFKGFFDILQVYAFLWFSLFWIILNVIVWAFIKREFTRVYNEETPEEWISKN